MRLEGGVHCDSVVLEAMYTCLTSMLAWVDAVLLAKRLSSSMIHDLAP
jgi:hypothetical protein